MHRLVKLFFFTLAVLTFLILLQAAGGYWVQFQVEKKLHLKIEGAHRPDFSASSFRIENLKMNYQDYFEVTSGDLKIRYNLLPMTSDLLHVWIRGADLKGKLKGKLASVPDADKEITFDRFEVEVKLVPRGVMLIAADIHSSVFKFKIQKTDDQKGQLLN